MLCNANKCMVHDCESKNKFNRQVRLGKVCSSNFNDHLLHYYHIQVSLKPKQSDYESPLFRVMLTSCRNGRNMSPTKDIGSV